MNPDLTLICCDAIACFIHGLKKTDLFTRVPIVYLPPSCEDKFVNRVKKAGI